jgi:tetratricopeptide (TPR) repeat protein
MDKFKYRAFISYSHADEKWARWLHRSLETYRIPKRLVGQKTAMGPVPAKLAPVFRDREELASATDLGSKLTEALEGSACLIVICSRSSAGSHWVNEEILAYKRLGRSDRVFSLIVDGEPYASGIPGEEKQECFPPALRFQIGPDGELMQTPAEPIAADARPGKDGKPSAKVKLIAGLLGVGFDDLRQRELQRRNRRLAAISTSAVFGMVFAIGLAMTAVVARNEAERQRERAEKESETAQRTASFMIDLFAVSDPSEARGETITAREILTNGAQRISTELGDQPEIQASLMDTIGKVYTSLGLYDDARRMLEETVTLRRELPGIPAKDFAQSAFNLGNVLTEQAEYQRAEQIVQEALTVLHPTSPDKRQLRLDLTAALAELHVRTGQYDQAEPLLRRVLDERRTLLGDKHPKVAEAIEKLGFNLFDQGEFSEAADRLREALALRRTILGDAPHPDIAKNMGDLALILVYLGDYDESEKLYLEALEMNRRLYGDTHPAVAEIMVNLADLYATLGELDQAETMYLDALDMMKQVLGEEHPHIAITMKNLAFVYHDEQKIEQAKATVREAMDMERRLLGEHHPEVASGMSILGQWLSESGEYIEAESLLRNALDIQQEVLEPDHPRLATTRIYLAEVLLATNQVNEALEHAKLGEASLSKSLGPDHWRTTVAKQTLGAILLALGEHADAEKFLLESYEKIREDPAVNSDSIRKGLQRLVALYDDWGKTASARTYEAILNRASKGG